MAAVIHHGPPGSFKTFSVIQYEVIPALQAGRIVVTNVRGLDFIPRIYQSLYKPLTRLDKLLSKKPFSIPDGTRLISIPHDNAGFQVMAEWYQWVPKNCLILMDEGQRVYPTRLKDLSKYDYPGGREQAEIDSRPATLEIAFDQHRHHGWDIYITTTNIAKINKEIRQVVEFAFRHRNLTGLLPWYKNEWKEVRHSPSNSGESASHCIGQYFTKKADSRYFNCYQSTEVDEATNVTHNPSIFKQPKIVFASLAIILGLGYQIWFWFIDVSDLQAVQSSYEADEVVS